MDDQNRSHIAFLDTNALHWLDLYLRYAKTHECFPFVPFDECIWHKKTFVSADLKTRHGYGREMLIWSHQQKLEIRYSGISFLELCFGRAKGRALQEAAAEGVPERMYTFFRENEVDDRTNADDLADIHSKLADLSQLEDDYHDIPILRANDDRDTWLVALAVSKLVVLSATDYLVYAAALAAQARYFVTDDNYLRKIATKLQQTKNDGMGLELRKLCADIMSLGDNAKRIVLPQPKKPGNLLNK